MIEAKVIKDSINEAGKRITTLQIKFHRFILPEFNTHRVFSRNFSSSRAIPVAKLIEQVRTDPAMPVYWGTNKPGMQAGDELVGVDKDVAKAEWRISANMAADQAEILMHHGLHKQTANRVLEPFLWVSGIVTSTEWDNWFALRAHPDAQPEIHELAIKMREAIDASQPQLLKYGEWHLPYITESELNDPYYAINANSSLLRKISAARCCRVSYLKHDGTLPNIDDDLALFQRLAGAVPIHASPLEHQAMADACNEHMRMCGNLQGWLQYRKLFESTELNT